MHGMKKQAHGTKLKAWSNIGIIRYDVNERERLFESLR
jgi:hypothetical protein